MVIEPKKAQEEITWIRASGAYLSHFQSPNSVEAKPVSKGTTIEISGTDLREHPAVKAWNELRPDCATPDRIRILQKAKKSQVYQLEGVGPAGSNVIAKRGERQAALLERKIYGEVLPHLPVTNLCYYGFLEEPDEDFCWIFLEEADGEPYSIALADHRVLAGQWLGAVHLSATRMAATAALPHRGPLHYLERLRNVCEAMQKGLQNPVLTAEDVDLVRTMISQLNSLERRGSEAAEFCDCMPPTLIHGDLVVKNVRVRNRAGRRSLLVMDWEFAGWGAPVLDLAQTGGKCIAPDLEAYRSVIQAEWPDLSAKDIEQLAHYGRIFRLVSVIQWVVRSLSSLRINVELRSDLLDLRVYGERLTALVGSANLT
jgi:hypothetical protein